MVEAKPSQERQEAQEVSFERIAGHFEKVGLPLGKVEINQLIQSVEMADLSTSQLTEVFGRVPIAQMRGHELTLDHRFKELNENQQTHIKLHELSHPLVTFLRQLPNQERLSGIVRTINDLPRNQVSYYVNYLEERFQNNPDRATVLEEEGLAEVFSQYLGSDRSFAGFIQAKLLQFPQADRDLDPSEKEEFEKIATQVGDLGEYLEIAESEEEWEAFLAHHSDLLPHYQLWGEMNALFEETDFSLLLEGGQDYDDGDEEEYWDDLALAEHLHPEPVIQKPRTIFEPVKPGEEKTSLLTDLITLWKIAPPS